jgi:hypothetical protein
MTIANQPALHSEALRHEFERGADSTFFRLDVDFDPRFFQPTAFDPLLLWRIPRSAMVWRSRRKTPIYRTDGPRFEHAMNILAYGDALASERGATLIVVLLDNNNSFADRAVDPDPWRRMRTALAARQITVIDPTPELLAMDQASRESVINATGVHFTPAANRCVAEVIAAALRQR